MNPPSIAEPRPTDTSAKADTEAGRSRPRSSGRGTARGEIDVFPANGVASIAQIGEALELTANDYQLIHTALSLDAHGDAASTSAPIYTLWPHLPVSDTVIGKVLGKTGMQVLALRKLAIRQLAGCMTAHEQSRI